MATTLRAAPRRVAALCVFCGSSPGHRPEYVEATQIFGRHLTRLGIGLIYGGASVGLMGVLADSVLEAGGHVIGVIPRALMEREIAHAGLSDLRVVETMHERKALMAELSDGFVALPGGAGTLEELFEEWTWAQLGLHQKPCGLLNVNGYYDSLGVFLAHSVAEGFLRPAHRSMLMIERSPERLLDRVARYEPPTESKWE